MHRTTIWLAASVTAAAVLGGVAPIAARVETTIIDDWYQAKLPAPPQLKPVTLEAKTTALLVMDFTVQTARRRAAHAAPIQCRG